MNNKDSEIIKDIRFPLTFIVVMQHCMGSVYYDFEWTDLSGSDIYNIRISYENPVISIDSGITSYMDYDSLTYYAMNNFWNREVTSISVRLDN